MSASPRKIHFIGIGGVGMSGIALVAHQRGLCVTGSDMKESRTVVQLREAGIEVHVGHSAANLAADVDTVVISTAIPEKNPELAAARERGLDIWHRSHMLAYLGVGKKTLACAGTHGKTTTSSMLATVVDGMGLDPSFLIGGTVQSYGTNAKSGAGDYYIVEADESDGSFVHLSPYAALITNIEADHLDHYGTIDAIYSAFHDFLSLLPDEGAAVVCADDPKLAQIARGTGKRTVTYGQAGNPDAQARFEITGRAGIGSAFTVTFPDGSSVDAVISRSPGRHNVLNATGVLTVVWALGLDVAAAAKALESFRGVRRRFDLVGEAAGVTVVDDYAHHPTEIKATLAAASQLGFNHVHVLFQPHRYTRTESLAPLFADAFDAASSVTMMDVYAAGEAPIPGVSGKTLVDSIMAHKPRIQCAWMPHRPEVVPYLCTKLSPGDLVLTMGAGDVTTMGPQIIAALENRE
ncbi:MAG: UDP-N-acetylmuramate--L-alanine ligase [Coriobacteriales bacterium]